MLDAFIIERIRQEREQRDSGLRPLRIHVPRPEEDPRWEDQPRDEDPRRRQQDDKDSDSERGVVIIDYNI